MELFAKIIKDYLLLTIFAKISTLDVWLGAEYASRIFRSFMNEKVCRHTNADLINSLYVHVHSKITPLKFHILNPQNSLVFDPRSLQNVCLQTIRTNRIEYFKQNTLNRIPIEYFLRKIQTLRVNNSRILSRIKNAKLLGYYFYINRNI